MQHGEGVHHQPAHHPHHHGNHEHHQGGSVPSHPVPVLDTRGERIQQVQATLSLLAFVFIYLV